MNLRRLIPQLLAVTAVTATVLVGVYIYKFGNISDPRLSNINADWGTFGDFIGGTLGTFFGLLAFLGVLFTVRLQQNQIEESERRSQLEELQRIISNISRNLDEILSAAPLAPIGQFAAPRPNSKQITVFVVLSVGGTLKLATRNLTDDEVARLSDSIKTLRNEADLLMMELAQLVWALERYGERGGSGVIGEFYVRRYGAVVAWMHALGFLARGDSAIGRYFNPQKIARALKGERTP